MKKILLATILITGLFSKGTNIDYTSDISIKNQILKIIKNGSTGLDYPMGTMPPGMSSGEEAEEIAEYLAGDKKGKEPKMLQTCKSCHGQKLQGMAGMSADISNLQDKERLICEVGAGERFLKDAENAKSKNNIFLTINLLEKACNCKNIKSCQLLSIMNINGIDIPINKEKGVGYLEKLCEYEDAESCQLSAIIYAEGKLVKKDISKSLSYLKKGCDLDFGTSCFILAKFTYEGENGVKKDKKIAMKLLDKACELKNEQACKDKERIEFSKQFNPGQIKMLNKAFKDIKIPKSD